MVYENGIRILNDGIVHGRTACSGCHEPIDNRGEAGIFEGGTIGHRLPVHTTCATELGFRTYADATKLDGLSVNQTPNQLYPLNEMRTPYIRGQPSEQYTPERRGRLFDRRNWQGEQMLDEHGVWVDDYRLRLVNAIGSVGCLGAITGVASSPVVIPMIYFWLNR